jgi:hypothetical protein
LRPRPAETAASADPAGGRPAKTAGLPYTAGTGPAERLSHRVLASSREQLGPDGCQFELLSLLVALEFVVLGVVLLLLAPLEKVVAILPLLRLFVVALSLYRS